MNKALLFTALALALVASAAQAGGVNLAWGTLCYAENPTRVVTFACDTNSPGLEWPLTLSYQVDSEMNDMVGIEITLVAQSSVDQLPDWWRLNAGECRSGAMGFEFDPGERANDGCRDWTGGLAMAGAVWNSGQDQYRPGDDPYWGPIYSSPSTARIIGVIARDAAVPGDVLPGVEYFACTYTIRNGATVGSGSCAGCGLPLAIEARLVCVAGLAGRRDYLMTAVPGGNQAISWQSEEARTVVPVRNSSWGEIKNLYR